MPPKTRANARVTLEQDNPNEISFRSYIPILGIVVDVVDLLALLEQRHLEMHMWMFILKMLEMNIQLGWKFR